MEMVLNVFRFNFVPYSSSAWTFSTEWMMKQWTVVATVSLALPKFWQKEWGDLFLIKNESLKKATVEKYDQH